MELVCLGSSSAGNCYLLTNDTECLVLEAGIPFKEVKIALDFNITKIVGVVALHAHGDHSHYIHEYEKSGIKCYKPYEEEEPRPISFGGFKLFFFPLVHDVPNFGVVICHKEIGKLLYAVDTEYIPQRFAKLNLDIIMVEANYSDELIESASTDDFVRNRVYGTHMELETTMEFLRVNKTPHLRHVVLCHLSDSHADPMMFKERAESVVDCEVHIAEPHTQIFIDDIPFM